jgi:hypothetical protein
MKKRKPKLLKKPVSEFWGMEWTDIEDTVIDLIKDWARRTLLSSDKSIPEVLIELARMINVNKKKISVRPDPIFDIGTGEVNNIYIKIDGKEVKMFHVDNEDIKEIYAIWKETYKTN